MKGHPQAPVLFNTRALHAPLPWEGERWSVIFYSAGGGGAALHASVAAAAGGQGFLGAQCLLKPLQLVRTNLWPKDRSATDHALLSPNNRCKVYHKPQ